MKMVELPTSRSPNNQVAETPPTLVHLPTLRLAQINFKLAEQV